MDKNSAFKLGLVIIGLVLFALGSMRVAKFIEYLAEGGPSGFVNALRFSPLYQVEDFLELGANPNTRDDDGRPLLLLLVEDAHRTHGRYRQKSDHIELITLLLDFGANVNLRSDGHLTPAEFARTHPRNPDFLEILDGAGAKTTYMSLVLDQNWDELQSWIERDPTLVNKQGYKGRTLLHWAAAARAEDFVDVLLTHGADVHQEDSGGDTAFTLAFSRSSEFDINLDGYGGEFSPRTPELDDLLARELNILDALLDSGAEMQLAPDYGIHLAHHLATIEGGVMEYERYDIDPLSNLQSKTGYSILFSAVTAGRTENAKWLWDRGFTEAPAFDFVPIPERHLELVELLLERGGKLPGADSHSHHSTNGFITSALWGRDGGMELLMLLLDYGMNVELRNPQGDTLLMAWIDHGMWALNEYPGEEMYRRNFHELGRLLLDHGANPLDDSQFHTNPYEAAEEAGCDICIEMFNEVLAARAAKLVGMAL